MSPPTSTTPTAPATQLGETLTNPRLATLPPVSGFRLPYGLRADYELVSMLPKRGGEAVLLTVRPRGADDPLTVLKLYSREMWLQSDVLQLVSEAAVGHVVTLLGYGTEQGVGYELLEYIPGGDLEDLVAGQGLLDERTARTAVAEIAAAIECIHDLAAIPLAHGDLKPANILVRSTQPLDLVLADFGMATLQHDVRSDVLGTPRWSDPRAHTGFIQPEGDWWSLGAIAYWLRTGRPLHSDLQDSSAMDYLRERNADLSALPAGEERDWTRLCEGLLVRDEHERWGAAQVRAWLDGGSPVVGSQWDEPEPIVVTAPEPTHPITFRSRTHHELAAFALALAEDWDESAALIDSRPEDLIAVLREHGRQTKDLDLVADIEGIIRADEPTDLRLSRLIRRLGPGIPPVFRRWTVDERSLAGLADQAAGNPHSLEAGAVSRLFADHILTAWDDLESTDAASLDSRWHVQVSSWEETFEAHSDADDDTIALRARAPILLALLRPAEATRLTKRATDAASRRARRTDWYDDLCRDLGDDPASDYAALSLAAAAEQATEEADAAARAERQRQAADRAAGSLIRVPRTRRILGWCLLVQSALVILWLVLRVLAPSSWAGLTPESGLRLWAEDLPNRVANWATWWTDPLIILPLFGVSALLFARARHDGPDGTVARHPLERRAMQGAIALTCLLVPPLIPIGIVGWWRGLQFYAPEQIRGRDALRTLTMGGGLASSALLVGLVVGVGPSPASLVLTTEYQEWAATPTAVTAPAGPMTSVGHLVGGVPATGLAAAMTVLVCALGPLLVLLAARAYAVDSRTDRRTMLGTVWFGVVGLINLPLAYPPQTWGMGAAGTVGAWLAWVTLRGQR